MEKGGGFEMDQPKVGPAGARRAGASESKNTEEKHAMVQAKGPQCP